MEEPGVRRDGSDGSSLHHFLAAPTEARSLRASIASRSVTARRWRLSTRASTIRRSAFKRRRTSASLDQFSPIGAPGGRGHPEAVGDQIESALFGKPQYGGQQVVWVAPAGEHSTMAGEGRLMPAGRSVGSALLRSIRSMALRNSTTAVYIETSHRKVRSTVPVGLPRRVRLRRGSSLARAGNPPVTP